MHSKVRSLSGQVSPMHWGPPVDDSTILYRYMDLSKFINLLLTKKLYFAKPSQFYDPSEGLIPEMVALAAKLEFMQPAFLREDWMEPGSNNNNPEKYAERFERERDFYGISCWHMSESDSEMMWKLYSGNPPSLAIVSTRRRVLQALGEDWYYDTAAVAYEQNHPLRHSGSFPLLLFNKRSNFSYEREWRVIINVKDLGNQLIPVNLNMLIDYVLIGPESEEFHIASIQKLLELTGLGDKRVIRSPLLDKPLEQIKAILSENE